MKKLALVFLLVPSLALAQSTPNWPAGYNPQASEVSAVFAGKVDVTGGKLGNVGTSTNCQSSASPAVCAAAVAGSSAVPTGSNPTLVVNTTAVTANSLILLTSDESLSTKLGVTCNSTITTVAPIVVTARSVGVSFTVQVDATVATNPACFNWLIIN